MRAALAVALIACGDNRTIPADAPAFTDGVVAGTNIVLRQIATVDGTVTLVTSPPSDPRLFVVGDAGKIWIVDNGQVLPEPFLDVTTGISPQFVGGNTSELGLLGLAFHPDYATNRTLFVNYTAMQNNVAFPYLDVTMRMQTRIDDPDRADPSTAVVVLAIPDFASNHNGGMLEFGPDGYLYIGDGDGGIADDVMRTAQDPFALLGKIHRLDVDHPLPGKEYGIPADNPFADGAAGAPEVFITGARNPWRFSFDSATGDLWIGDVGQATIEEIDVLHQGHMAGANLGWSKYEGNNCFHGPCDPTGLVFPVDSRVHDDYCAIIGGEVYRGALYPDLVGEYFYTDYCRGGLVRGHLLAGDAFEAVDVPGDLPARPSCLHHAADGELYVADVYGNIYHIEAIP
jgi:glucose/arabinose dehydrogenase